MSRQFVLFYKVVAGIEPVMTVLQTVALPLGYTTVITTTITYYRGNLVNMQLYNNTEKIIKRFFVKICSFGGF